MIRFFLAFAFVMSASLLAADELQRQFQSPPDDVRPSVYWYWVNDNISKEGVVRDLEAMKEVGIGRAFIGNIGEQGGGYGKVKVLSDEWFETVHEALKTATRLGIDIGMFNSPGWSQSGGPWVKPERSMRYLASSEAAVVVVEESNVPWKLDAPGPDFQDVKTLAFRSLDSNETLEMMEPEPKITTTPKLETKEISPTETAYHVPTGTNTVTVDYVSKKEFTARSIFIIAQSPSRAKIEFLAKENGEFRSIKTARYDRSNPALHVGFTPYVPCAISIPATTSKEFRLVFSEIHGKRFPTILTSSKPVIESFAEKTLAKMWPTPLPLWDAYMWPDQPKLDDPKLAVNPKDIIDVTEFMQPDGTLRWKPPRGEWWTIMRTGMVTTGVRNGPASPEAKGLEIDKMSKEHVAFHFDAYLGEILKRIPEADRKSLKVAVQDSYETGGQNWTDGFIEEFQKVYGYNPTPYIPVMSGTVVGSPEISDRFLWDLRRLIADKVAYDYVGGLKAAANKHGMTTWLECYGHWGFPGEFLQYGGQSDGIAGEFWNEGDLGSIENRAASSCGHIYGKTKITAESFTAAGNQFGRYPRLLKKRCDWSYTEGINDTLLHLYIHQPYDDKTPGMNAWFATEFNRKNTWFYQMKPFVEYMRRCMFLLQQGQNVADVAYFIGEDAPKMTGVCDPPLPKGYSFDYINGEVIRNSLSVKDGRLVLPHGTSYRLLVLPNQTTMRPETLKKIKQLVEAGAVVCGPKPTRSPSLQNYPACDEEVRKMADELWGGGKILTGKSIQEILDSVKVPADCLTDNSNTLYVHRTLSNGDEVYFLTNQIDEPISFNATFRVADKQPELWDAVDGTMRNLPGFDTKDGLATVPLKLDAWGSAFIVFRNPVLTRDGYINKTAFYGSESARQMNFPDPKIVQNIDGPWTVQFESDEVKRGPKEPQKFEKLIDLSTSENEAIKYYSGKIVYSTTFKLDAVPEDEKMYVNLGNVQVVAAVKVNGQDAGGLWTAPWQVDVTKLVKPGDNTLEIEVVNTWINRLIGDKKLPENERKTWATVDPYKADSPLVPSGLIGPVRILNEK